MNESLNYQEFQWPGARNKYWLEWEATAQGTGYSNSHTLTSVGAGADPGL